MTKPTLAVLSILATLLEAVAGLLWDVQVLGYALAEKESGAVPTGEVAVRFYVRRRFARARLKAERRVPRRLLWMTGGSKRGPQTIKPDVVELRHVPEAQRVVRPGESIGHFVGTQGSLGVIVDHPSGRLILPCSHVLAPPVARQGDPVESPADGDGVPGPNTVGQLVSRTVFQVGLQHDMDAALAPPLNTPGLSLTNANLPLRQPPRFAKVTPQNAAGFLNHPVLRVASGTSQAGVFDSIENNIPVAMLGNVFRFSGVFAYLAPNGDGDSGAPVVDRITGEILGLHFAGRPELNKGWIIPGATIARRLGIRVAAV